MYDEHLNFNYKQYKDRKALSQDQPDIRGSVEESRGVLKKLQLLIPGLRGYRKLEDLRVSDELLRNQLADKLDQARINLNLLRQKVALNNDLMNLSQVGSLISQIQALSGEIRHAQQGYSGFVAPISINEDRLNKLYELDYGFASLVFKIVEDTSDKKLVYDPSSPGSVTTALTQLYKEVLDLRSKWSQRIEEIEGILLTGGKNV